MNDNPYQTELGGDRYTTSGVETPLGESIKLREDLASLARWQAFFGVLGAITCFLFTIITIFQILFILGTSGIGGIEGLFSLGLFILVIVAYGLPTSKLLRASQSARLCAGQSESLSKVVETQRAFWRTLGIIFCVFLGTYLSLIAFALVLGISFSNFL